MLRAKTVVVIPPIDKLINFFRKAQALITEMLPQCESTVGDMKEIAKWNVGVCDSACSRFILRAKAKMRSHLNSDIQEHLLLMIYSTIMAYELGYSRPEDASFVSELFAIYYFHEIRWYPPYYVYPVRTILNDQPQDVISLLFHENPALQRKKTLCLDTLGSSVLFDPHESSVAFGDKLVSQVGEIKEERDCLTMRDILLKHGTWGSAITAKDLATGKRKKSSIKNGQVRRIGVKPQYPTFNLRSDDVYQFIETAFTLMRADYISSSARPAITGRNRRYIENLPNLRTLFFGGKHDADRQSLMFPGEPPSRGRMSCCADPANWQLIFFLLVMTIGVVGVMMTSNSASKRSLHFG